MPAPRHHYQHYSSYAQPHLVQGQHQSFNKHKPVTNSTPSPSSSVPSTTTTTPASPRSSSRIPATLQAVFLASNRGKEVHKPPPERVAAKVFFRNWFHHGQQSSRNGGGTGGVHDVDVKPRAQHSFWGMRGLKQPSTTVNKDRSVSQNHTIPSVSSASSVGMGSVSTSPITNVRVGTTRKSSVGDVPVRVAYTQQQQQQQQRYENNTHSSSAGVAIRSSPKYVVTSNSSPRSVMTSQLQGKGNAKVGIITKPVAIPAPVSPQVYLDTALRARGYSTIRYKTLQSAYYSKPTPLQQASYHVHLQNLVRQGHHDALRRILEGGISPNPCNVYGESLLHLVCRRGDSPNLIILLQHGCQLQVADDYGRTPLHDACWAAQPCFPVVERLLQFDRRLLFLTDTRGAVPLSYVRKENWGEWNVWLESKLDILWPIRNIAILGEEGPPPLAEMPPNSRSIPDPTNALTPELAALVASGKMAPDQAQYLMYDTKIDVTAEDDSDDDDSSSEDDDDSSEYSTSSDEEEDDDDNDGCSSDESQGGDTNQKNDVVITKSNVNNESCPMAIKSTKETQPVVTMHKDNPSAEDVETDEEEETSGDDDDDDDDGTDTISSEDSDLSMSDDEMADILDSLPALSLRDQRAAIVDNMYAECSHQLVKKAAAT